MRTLMTIVLLCALVAMAQAAPAHNGDFEHPVVRAGRYVNYAPGSRRAMPGWTVVGPRGSAVSIISGAFTSYGYSFPADTGNQWLDLTGPASNQRAGVRTTFATVPGATYTLSFHVGNAVDPGGHYGSTSTVGVTINNGTLQGFTAFGGRGTHRQAWQHFTLPFVAPSSTTVVTFINLDPRSDNENGLDNVSLTMTKPAPTQTH